MTEFNYNLCRVLACTLVLEVKGFYSPNGIVDDARNDDDAAPSPSDSTDEAMHAYLAYLPHYMKQAIKWQPKLEAGKVQTAEEFSPRWTGLQTSLYGEFGPQLAATARDIDAANKLGGAEADLSVLRGPGAESVRAVTDMLRETDPEFFALREQAAGQISDLLKPGLTGAEEEAINRKLARDRVGSGISNPTPANTVAEAMQFGDAARNRTLQGVAAVNSFLPSSRTGFDPTQVALGRPSMNTGDSKFLGVQQPANAEQTQGNFFNQIAGFQQSAMDINANRRDWMDRVNEGVGSVNV